MDTLYVGQSREMQRRLSGDSDGFGRHRMWGEVLRATGNGWIGKAGIWIWECGVDRMNDLEWGVKKELEPFDDREPGCVLRYDGRSKWRYREPDFSISMEDAYSGDWGGLKYTAGVYAWVVEDLNVFCDAHGWCGVLPDEYHRMSVV